jgi:ribonucleoside-diphosphate reductase alpha chain
MISKHEAGRKANGNGLKARPKTVKKTRGYSVSRYFTTPNVHPFDALEWELRTAAITGETGKVYFEQKDVEVPKGWSATATNVVVQKYFRGKLGTPQRERSVKQLVGRVANTITDWGKKDSYFAGETDAENFRAELTHLLVNQMMAFNSPVWFNVGVEEHPQCSACFINSVEDSMESILGLAKTEGMLFKYGSGTGSNLSCLRSSKEHLNGGGTASGPVSFMRGFDAFAGVIKSGGKTRRAAKMVILNADHPDIIDFIECKATEERKAWALIDAGYEGGFNVPGGAYDSVFYQNANHSVRVTDEFMEAVLKDRDWATRSVVNRQAVGTYRARDLMRKISDAAHQCGDPGLQFDTTVNAWHTSPRSGRINASNPCSEYMYLDDSACNLASLNLRKFQKQNGELDVESVKRAVETTILAMEIIVGNSKYPTDRIRDNSFKYRPLGLGYANLGALLMSRGQPYDSEPARAYAAAVTALLCGEAYATSAKIARDSTGPFDGYEPNREPFLNVMEKHRRACDTIDQAYVPHDLMEAARHSWDDALMVGREFGFRNGQATVLAPTGTIGFMMDCDTTGIEPDIALVKYKRLVGGGTLKIVNGTVPEALAKLGYDAEQIKKIVDYIDENETIEGAPGLKDEHLPVFDCAFRAANGTRSIHYMGHIRMMSATQPFLSGAISKTVNLPNDCTVEDIETAYLEAWKLGLKAIAVYRDGCKRTQPLSTGIKKEEAKALGAPAAVRRKLPDERQSITHKFSVAGHEGYITVGLYEDGSLGEIFIRMAKEGSTMSGLMDSFATAISLSLQHGVPLRLLVDKFARTRFEPSGFTGNPDVPRATSIMDYIFRWLALKFLGEVQNPALLAQQAEKKAEEVAAPRIEVVEAPKNGNGNGKSLLAGIVSELDAPMCRTCGTKMVRNGACHKCPNCGDTDGCS